MSGAFLGNKANLSKHPKDYLKPLKTNLSSVAEIFEYLSSKCELRDGLDYLSRIIKLCSSVLVAKEEREKELSIFSIQVTQLDGRMFTKKKKNNTKKKKIHLSNKEVNFFFHENINLLLEFLLCDDLSLSRQVGRSL